MMIKQKRIFLLIALGAFLAIQALLGLLLQTAGGRATAIFSYTAIVLSCLFCGVSAVRSKVYLFTQLGLLFTVGADYFLVYSPDQRQLLAMILFSLTQLCYFLRLWHDEQNKARRPYHAALRIALTCLALLTTVIVLREKTDALALVSIFYYSNLALNTVFAFTVGERPPLLAIALVLFMCCDTVIGLSLLDTYFTIDESALLYRILHPDFNLAWVFYLPSQALIAISLLPTKLNPCNNTKNRSDV